MHASNTAGAQFFSISYMEEGVILTPAECYCYYQHIAIDSTDCNQYGCKYWVRGIQVDEVVSWSELGYVCSLLNKGAVKG